VPTEQEGCRICAVVEAGPAAGERLAAALAASDVASVLIAPAPRVALDAAAARPLVELTQQRNVAALITDDAGLARTLRADGVHLSARKDIMQAFEEARGIVGRSAIVGVDVGLSRHDAMTLAEAEADYVAFGAPATLQDREKGRARRDELIAWWAEIFEVPCVAFDVETPDEAEALSRAGADFVAVTLSAGLAAADASDLVSRIAAAARMSEAAD
jgi:thiamine-phosphate pyrophosphorylase